MRFDSIFPIRDDESITDWTLRFLSDAQTVHNFPADGRAIAAETGRDSREAGTKTAVPSLQIVRGK